MRHSTFDQWAIVAFMACIGALITQVVSCRRGPEMGRDVFDSVTFEAVLLDYKDTVVVSDSIGQSIVVMIGPSMKAVTGLKWDSDKVGVTGWCGDCLLTTWAERRPGNLVVRGQKSGIEIRAPIDEKTYQQIMAGLRDGSDAMQLCRSLKTACEGVAKEEFVADLEKMIEENKSDDVKVCDPQESRSR